MKNVLSALLLLSSLTYGQTSACADYEKPPSAPEGLIGLHRIGETVNDWINLSPIDYCEKRNRSEDSGMFTSDFAGDPTNRPMTFSSACKQLKHVRSGNGAFFTTDATGYKLGWKFRNGRLEDYCIRPLNGDGPSEWRHLREYQARLDEIHYGWQLTPATDTAPISKVRLASSDFNKEVYALTQKCGKPDEVSFIDGNGNVVGYFVPDGTESWLEYSKMQHTKETPCYGSKTIVTAGSTSGSVCVESYGTTSYVTVTADNPPGASLNAHWNLRDGTRIDVFGQEGSRVTIIVRMK